MSVIIKIAATGITLAGIITLITPASPVNPGMAIILFALIIMWLSSGMKLRKLFYSNILILLFTGSFCTFILITSFIESATPDPLQILSIALKTILIFNLLRISIAWLGTPGLLWLTNIIPYRDVQVYILLFFRGVRHFLRTNSLVIHQIRSRINISTKQKYLIPRYYAYNIMMKEINMLTYYEAALAARAGQIPACYSVPLKEVFVACIIIAAFVPAWIVLL